MAEKNLREFEADIAERGGKLQAVRGVKWQDTGIEQRHRSHSIYEEPLTRFRLRLAKGLYGKVYSKNGNDLRMKG